MADMIRQIEDKINASKATYQVYKEEIDKIKKQLKEKGVRMDNIDKEMQNLLGQLEELGKRERQLIRRVKKTIEVVEKRFK